MNKITKICHLADIHIRRLPSRNAEYQQVFENLYKSLNEQKPDRIVIVGDLVHDYIDLQGEQLILVANFLNNLVNICPLRIIRGNHDFLKKNNKRIDSIEAIVKTINNPNIIYYNKTGFYIDENVTWCVWHHGEKNNDPWKSKEGKEILKNKDNNQMYIDLFHETIFGSRNPNNFENTSKVLVDKNELKGDFSFLGHIHKTQYL